MTIQTRLDECKQKFETQQQEREQALRVAEDCLTEMTKLQGEFRVLTAQLEESEEKSETAPVPEVTVKDEGKKKNG